MTTQHRSKIPLLDGLRGLAASFVVLSHLGAYCVPWAPATTPHQSGLWVLLSLSQFGMTLFFTLSGFVIVYNYLDMDWKGRPVNSLITFTYLRFTRLYPLLLVFLVISLIARPIDSEPMFGAWMALHIFSIETWVPAQFKGDLPISGNFTVAWSISTEFGMYFAFAFAAIFAKITSRTKLIAIAGLYALFIATAGVLINDHRLPVLPYVIEPLTPDAFRKWFFYLSPYFRLLEFGFGGIAAWFVLRRTEFLMRARNTLRPLGWIAVGLLVGIAAFTHGDIGLGTSAIPFSQTLVALLFAVIMLNAIDTASPLNAALSVPALVGLGTISYSMYLLHPFAPRFGVYAGIPFSVSLIPTFALNLVLATGGVLLLAYGAYWLIEHPARAALRSMGFAGQRRGLGTAER